MSATTDPLSTSLRTALTSLPGQDQSWLAQRRNTALATFEALGFPTVRDEDWKYTNVRNIERRTFALSESPSNADAIRDAVAELNYDAAQVIAPLVDGFPCAGQQLDTLPPGATLLPLADALAHPDHTATVQAHLGQVADASTDGFAAMNATRLAEGYYLHVAAGVKIEQPITILSIALAEQEFAANPRHLVVLEERADAHVVEHCVSVTKSAYLHNTVTEVVLHPHATLEHTKLQEESHQAFHIATLEAHLETNAKMTSHAMSVGGAIARYDINVHLRGEHASCVLNGLYLGSGRQHVDFHTRIHHVEPNCNSEQLYKGVLGGSARGVFNGQVHVHAHAQKSDAQQSNHNLLLSRNAEIDTKPQLEILADDVKCSHGTTVGQIDNNMLFYLRSRGVPEVQARGLLTYGFAQNLVERLTIAPLAARMERILMEALPHGDELKTLVEG